MPNSDEMKDKGAQAAQQMKEKAQQAKEKAGPMMDQAKQKAGPKVDQAKNKIPGTRKASSTPRKRSEWAETRSTR